VRRNFARANGPWEVNKRIEPQRGDVTKFGAAVVDLHRRLAAQRIMYAFQGRWPWLNYDAPLVLAPPEMYLPMAALLQILIKPIQIALHGCDLHLWFIRTVWLPRENDHSCRDALSLQSVV
jgi:hypothetical protein